MPEPETPAMPTILFRGMSTLMFSDYVLLRRESLFYQPWYCLTFVVCVAIVCMVKKVLSQAVLTILGLKQQAVSEKQPVRKYKSYFYFADKGH